MTSTEQDRTVLITGSTSGIGPATARPRPHGWRVVVIGRQQTRGKAVVDDIAHQGGWAVFVPSDLTGPPEVLRAFARAASEAAGGHLDAVVHNAALGPPVDTVSPSDDDLEATLAARNWAAEFGPAGVRVNTVSPGSTRTLINDDSNDVITQMTAGIPAQRPGTPEEIAAAITWLLSDQANYLHGAEIPVDGGIIATRTQ